MDKFVLNVPKWQGELLFTKEMLVFVGIIILFLVGILFCFWGYKYFRTVLFLGIGAVVSYASFLLIEPMTGNPVVRMFLTVSLTFLGICIVYFLDIILGYFMDRLRLRSILGKNIFLLAAPLGAVIIGLTIYWFIWRGLTVSVVTAGVCGAAGLIFQYINRKKTVRFRCYNDLLQMPRPKTDENGLEYIVMDTVVLTGAAAAATNRTGAEPEHEAEIKPERIEEPMPEPETAFVSESEMEHVVELEAEPEPVEPIATEESESVPEPGAAFVSESEPEPVIEPMPEPVVEPGSEPEPVEPIATEESESVPEPGAAFVPESETEPVMLLEPEPVVEPGSEPEPVEPIATEESESVPEPAADVEPGSECVLQPMPVVLDTESAAMETMELSDTIRRLIISGLEPQEEILEDALFVQKMKESVAAGRQVKQLDIGLAAMAAGRHVEAVTAAQREAADVMNKAADAMSRAADAMNRATESASGTDIADRRRQKLHRKQDNRLAKGAAVAVAGIGLFFAGRASKGRDQT